MFPAQRISCSNERPPFRYHHNRLHCESVALEQLTTEYGTPLYVYSAESLRANIVAMQAAFAALQPLICFAVKANDNLVILRTFAAARLGFDVVSGGELHRAQLAGAQPGRCAFAGAGKTDAESRRKQRVPLRLNPGVTPDTHRYIVTGSAESKFGLPPEDARRLADAQWPNLVLRGAHIHIGSELPETAPLLTALDCALEFLEALPANWDTLDIGGGFPVQYRPEGSMPTVPEFAKAIAARLQAFPRRLRLIVEPGRSLLAVMDVGAYGYSMTSHYNAHPRPAEVLVKGDSYRLIRRRESYADLNAADVRE